MRFLCRAVLATPLLFAGIGGYAQSFNLNVGTSAVTIHPGDTNVPIPVTLTGDGTYSDPVTVTLTGLPSGLTVTPLTLFPGSSGTLLLNASVAADQEAFPATSFTNPDISTTTITAVALSGALESTASLSLTVSLENPSFAPQPNQIDLPILSINTSGTPINSKFVDVAGTVTITSADGQTSYLPGTAGSDNTAVFHVHGNSTSYMPKLPYEMKLNTSTDLLAWMGVVCPYVTGSGKATCDKSKTYILLANYDDKTMLRDWAASALANAIPIGGNYLNETPNSPSPSGTSTLMPWAPHSLFVELYLNGQYEGTYQLIEKVNVDSHRLNINEMTDTNISGNALTGGYQMEIDNHLEEDYLWYTPQGLPVGLNDPDFSPEVPEQTSYITNYVNTAENALFSSNYTDPTLGWRAYFDEASAVNYYIVNDLMGNVDGGDFYSSVYLYKDKNNPLIYMGPIWDFDISSGNVNYQPIVDPTVPWTTVEAPWYAQWFSDPSFKAAAQQQWNALKSSGILSSWLASITTESATLQQTQQNNFGRWPMLGVRVWPNPEAVGSYNGEVSYLTNWIGLRMGYMDGFLNNLSPTSTVFAAPNQTLRTGTPMTLTAQVTGNSPTGEVSFSYNSIVLGQAALNAAGVATLTVASPPAGTYALEAYYNGDSANSISGAISQPVTVLPALIQSTSNLTSPTTASYGSPVTVTAAVVGVSGSSQPTGSFTFTANGVSIGTATVSPTGIATLTSSTIPAGTETLAATYSGDTNYASSTTNAIPLVIVQATPSLNWATPAAITYGTSLSAAQLNANSQTPGTISYNPPAGTVLPAGLQTLTAVLTPTDSNDYAAASSSVQILVNKQPTSINLATSASSIAPNQPVTITAAVSPAISGVPTGTFSFYVGSHLLGTASAISGSASYTSMLFPGSRDITAVYSGDANYGGSQSAAAVVAVMPFDFSVATLNPAAGSISPAGSLSFGFSISPLYGRYPGTVSFSVAGLPPGFTYKLSPTTLAADAGSTNVGLKILPVEPTAANRSGLRGMAVLAFTLLILPFSRRAQRGRLSRALKLLLLFVGVVAATGLSGCGSAPEVSQAYTVTVTATSGSLQHAVTFALNEIQ